jgi:hypothetical protein
MMARATLQLPHQPRAATWTAQACPRYCACHHECLHKQTAHPHLRLEPSRGFGRRVRHLSACARNRAWTSSPTVARTRAERAPIATSASNLNMDHNECAPVTKHVPHNLYLQHRCMPFQLPLTSRQACTMHVQRLLVALCDSHACWRVVQIITCSHALIVSTCAEQSRLW